MISVQKSRLECVIYRSIRALTLVAFAAYIQYKFDIFANLSTAAVAVCASVAVQILLLIKLPTNGIIPVKIIRDDPIDFLKEEGKFALVVTFLVFFLGLNIDPLHFGVVLFGNFVLQSLVFFSWRVYNKHLVTDRKDGGQSRPHKNVVIIGASGRGMKVADIFLDHPELETRVLGFADYHRQGLWRYRDIPLIGHPENIRGIISCNQVDYVVIALENGDHVRGQKVFNTVESMGVKVCLLPEIYEQSISKCRPYSLNGQPVFLYHSVPENRLALFIKEVMDRIGGVVGLILSSPILLMATIAIKIDSRGPIFFRQKRMGRDGRVFDMFKLRTMINEAEAIKDDLNHLNEMSGPVFKIENDPRVTSVGRFLRKYSIDEIPQFYNVLKGDMSLVGPRPPLPREVEKYEPWQHRKLSVKPGLSCLWQVNGRNDLDFDHWMKLDLQYIDNWSLLQDAKILVQTIPAVLKGKGAS
jgi:exopolysaccharide biosynthesis polyprenyl glycosylphosphotransferase